MYWDTLKLCLPDLLSLLKSALYSPSFSAMLGAFSAYSLVALTDWRRKRGKKKILLKLVNANREILEAKLEAVKNVLGALEQKGELNAGPLQCFSTADIRKLQIEVLDLLSVEEKIALDTLCFHMDTIDAILESCVRKADKLRDNEIDDDERKEKVLLSVRNDYLDIRENLVRLGDFMTYFLDGDYERILRDKRRRRVESVVTL